jgi:hypothetical protein
MTGEDASVPAGPSRGRRGRVGAMYFDTTAWSLHDDRILTAQSMGADEQEGTNCRVKIWDSNTGALLHVLRDHTNSVRA